jgi:uncharacterized protein
MPEVITPTAPTKYTPDNLLRAALVSNKKLQLIILPTEKCNFRCTYCYEDFMIGKMKDETIQGIKALLDRRCSEGLEDLQLTWFGGEPLLGKDVVFEISSYAKSLTVKYPKLRYGGDMTTNGYLLDYKMAAALSEVGVNSYQISLDGPREIHDKTRRRADGKGTFDNIWENLQTIRDSSLPINILLRIHLTPENISSMDLLIDDIKREFLHDSRFQIYLKPIEHLGGANDSSMEILSDEQRENIITALNIKIFAENPTSSSDLYPIKDVCYASKANSLVIRANGDVGKCTVALNDERNKIATLQTDGTLQLIPGRLAPWLRGIATLDLETLACPLAGLP